MPSYDYRETIREVIGTEKALNPDSWEEQWVLEVTHNGETYDVPMYMCEETRSKDLPAFPFIDMCLMRCDYKPHDIAARTREHEAYIDVSVYYTQSDEYDSASFGRAIMDALVDAVRDAQQACGFGENFVNVQSIKLHKDNGKTVVFRYLVEIYCVWWDR